MATFNPASLVPASSIAAFSKAGGQRSTKQVALDNIKKQIELIDPKQDGKRTFWDTLKDGKKSYTGQGSHVAFTIRVNNKSLKLSGDVSELAAPKADFKAALEHFAAQVAADKFADQLAGLEAAREQRTTKMKATRAAKPKTK